MSAMDTCTAYNSSAPFPRGARAICGAPWIAQDRHIGVPKAQAQDETQALTEGYGGSRSSFSWLRLLWH